MTPVSVPATCPMRYQLWIMMRRLRVGILTTRSPKGLMTSRPLLTANSKNDVGLVLRFFVSADHLWVRDIALDANVSVVYADVNQALFVAVSGSARLIRNPLMQQKLWTPWVQQGLPGGPLDPLVRILEIDVKFAVLQNGSAVREITREELDIEASREAQPRSADVP
jgi:general stress protein 26